jgi:hypothetical protein
MATPIPFIDPAFLAQVVRSVIESMSGTIAPVALAPPTAPVTPVSLDNIVVLVRTVKNMRELGCEAFLGEQDVEIIGRWLRKVENVMTQMRVPED